MRRTERSQVRMEPEFTMEPGGASAPAGSRHDLPLAGRVPNAETMEALIERADALRQFDSVDDLFADIEAGRAETSGSGKHGHERRDP